MSFCVLRTHAVICFAGASALRRIWRSSSTGRPEISPGGNGPGSAAASTLKVVGPSLEIASVSLASALGAPSRWMRR